MKSSALFSNTRRSSNAIRFTAALFALFPSACARAQNGEQVDANSKTWSFTYAQDAMRPGAMLDLRALNEKEAGQSGFVRLSPDGSGFVLGNGKPVRFWAVGSDVYRQSPEGMARHARFLAKLGVNMVRLHTQVAPTGAGVALTDVNEKEIDGIWRFVAAMKKEGIYTTISPYWANGKDAAQWGIDGYAGHMDLWGLLFFDETLQQGYKAWVKALYSRPNPYTGMPLAQDPSVAIIQVQNEDSLFFWTLQGMKQPEMAKLERKFGQWLAHKYGTLEGAKQAWSGVGQDQDNFPQGQAGIFPTWFMTQPQTGGMARRIADQVEFLAETQRKFYADIARYYRQDLGCKQLINASNWITADPIKLNDVERWTYTANDVIAVNKYYNGGVHIGDNDGWRIDPGHYFSNTSALLDPRDLPTNLKQVAGHPTIITESSWVSPLGYQAEGPFLMAAYQSLTGVNTFYWFSATRPEYEMDPFISFLHMNGDQHPLFKWSASIPGIMANFPANALLYRMGYLKQGAPAVHEERSLGEMWNRVTPVIAEDKSFDPNRNAGNTGEQSNIKGGVDPLAFLVGPVQVKYDGAPANTHAIDLKPYIDHDRQIVKSDTGQITLDYGSGLCTLDAPEAQGACGFLKKFPAVSLSDVTIRSGNEYAAVLVVAMDQQPLRFSKKVLVQVGTVVRPTGWTTRETDFKSSDGKKTFHGYQIVNTGTLPWRVADTVVTLTLRNKNIKKATLLDTAGFALKEVAGTNEGGAYTIKLPSNAMYVVLE